MKYPRLFMVLSEAGLATSNTFVSVAGLVEHMDPETAGHIEQALEQCRWKDALGIPCFASKRRHADIFKHEYTPFGGT